MSEIPEVEIENLKTRVGTVEKNFEKLESSIAKIWSKIDEYRSGQIITQTIVEGIRKDVNDGRIDNAKVLDKLADKLDGLKTDMAKADIKRVEIESSNNEKRLIAENVNNEKQGGKWENMYLKVAATVIGVLLSIVLFKLGLK